MKHIRNILLLITIIFAFVMQAEVYQNMLWNFNGAYYLSSRYTTTNDDMDSFLANAEDTAEKHGVHIFSTFNQRVSNYQTRLYIYDTGTSALRIPVRWDAVPYSRCWRDSAAK